MPNQWFRWEREASIHLLFPTLEVFYAPLSKYSGVKAPTMVLVFEKGVVTWCIPEEEFINYGRKLLKVYSDPKKEAQMVKDINESLSRLKRVEENQEKLDLEELSDTELIKAHQEIYLAFMDYYTMGAIGTPLSFAAEIDLKAKGLTDQELNDLTTPDEISYVSQADEYLLETQDLSGFVKQYFWIDNNYSRTKVLLKEEAGERLKLLLSAKQAPEEKDGPSLPRVKLNNKDERSIELLKHYAIYKDIRKKEILIYLHFVDRILQEIAGRKGLSVDEVRASCPFEVEDVMNRKLSKEDLQERLKFCVVVWEKGKDHALVLRGLEGKKWEEKTLQKTGNNVKTIKGTTACKGKVEGKVKVLLKAGDSDQIKQGEILVTFMTSPDFMPAIRKCSAIVTNLGGVTSHAAIISRELQLPCIVGTKIATQVLKDGDWVEVNADNGIVRILK